MGKEKGLLGLNSQLTCSGRHEMRWGTRTQKIPDRNWWGPASIMSPPEEEKKLLIN